MEYMKANFAHEFRTPFSAINISLSSLQKVFPVLLEGYVKACNSGLMEDTFRCDYLQLIEKSVKNSLIELKLCDQYMNRLLLLLKEESIGYGPFEMISLRDVLEHVFSQSQLRESHCYHFASGDNFNIEFNKNELELCLQMLIEEIIACQNEQQADAITVHIDSVKKELTFEMIKSKSNSYIGDCITQFMTGDFHQRYGLGCYLFNQLLISNQGEISVIEYSNIIQFIIRF